MFKTRFTATQLIAGAALMFAVGAAPAQAIPPLTPLAKSNDLEITNAKADLVDSIDLPVFE